ncbi:MAG: sulfite exporter TauE/SafE family protein [Pseudomonadota bacterium]
MVDLSLATATLTIGSGAIVGVSLGLIGGGGSILAVPLLAYVIGVSPAHAAIGTSALAVAANAGIALAGHARSGTVKWRCAAVFASAGVLGAYLGSSIGKRIDGEALVGLFSIVIVMTAIAMLRPRTRPDNPEVRLTRDSAGELLPRLLPLGFGTGLMAGFFGIGGGFLIVPGLVFATGMPILNAIASSLVAVAAFGFMTAANYAWSGLIDWPVAGLFLIGGLVGGLVGERLARTLAIRRKLLQRLFAAILLGVATYVAARGLGVL